MELRSILGKMAPPYSPTPFFTLVLLVEEAHLLEKMAPPYNLASFSSKTSPFYFETLRTYEIHIFFTFPKSSLDLLSCFQCLQMVYHLGKHGVTYLKRFCSWRKGIFLGEGPLVGGSSSTSNLLRLATTSIFVMFSAFNYIYFVVVYKFEA